MSLHPQLVSSCSDSFIRPTLQTTQQYAPEGAARTAGPPGAPLDGSCGMGTGFSGSGGAAVSRHGSSTASMHRETMANRPFSSKSGVFNSFAFSYLEEPESAPTCADFRSHNLRTKAGSTPAGKMSSSSQPA